MAFTLPTGITHGSKSGARHPTIYSGVDELNHNNNSRDRGGDNYHNLWSALSKWSGDNITHTSATSGGLADSDSVFTITTAGSDFSLEIVTRAASQVIQVEEIERTIETTATTTSLSVFSQ